MNSMPTFSVLLSCMHQKNHNIILESNIHSKYVVVNQCNYDNTEETENGLWINSSARGISCSRNLALQNAKTDICLLSDDDECMEHDCEQIILKAYTELKDADVILFDVEGCPTKLLNKAYKLWKYEVLRASTVHTTFKRKSVIGKHICFDLKLGPGTGNGCGEDSKFLLDCINNGLNIYHYPKVIASLKPSQSSWFEGYNEKFFYQRGMVTRYCLGIFISCIYAFYYIWTKRSIYSNYIGLWDATKAIYKGILDNKLNR